MHGYLQLLRIFYAARILKKRNLFCVSSGVNVRDVPEDASKHEKQIAGVFPTMKLYSLMCSNAMYGND